MRDRPRFRGHDLSRDGGTQPVLSRADNFFDGGTLEILAPPPLPAEENSAREY